MRPRGFRSSSTGICRSSRISANPDKFDNKGFLKDASPELRQKIIDGRTRNREKQIDNFRKQIEQAGGGG